jgi:peptidyl-prolyl cis-trans isomerase A (cyclophilin A)
MVTPVNICKIRSFCGRTALGQPARKNVLPPYLLVAVVAAWSCVASAAPTPDLKEQKPDPTLLKDPKASGMTKQAPAKYQVKFVTSKGDFVIEVQREWAPNGADRFYNLAKNGWFDDARFFRVIKGFMAQFGINGDPSLNSVWKDANIQDDPVKQSNTKGMVSFATRGPNTRTTQLFINFADNNRLDGMGFAPFGKVVSGMDVVDALNGEYGEGAPRGRGPDQGRIQSEGNAYLKKDFDKLDYVKTARVLE